MIRAMRDVIIAANWKMHTTPADAGELATTIAARTRVADVVRVICPPYVALAVVRDALAVADLDVGVGAQNVHHELQGAYTGEVSAPMLVGLASWVIVGHSERRRDAAETDDLIGRKLGRAVDAGLRPILCVGEQLDDREAGRQVDVVRRQLVGALADHDPDALVAGGLVIAYEPVWAIGTGRNATGADAAAMSEAIRSIFDDVWGLADSGAAALTPVLYGGSVTSANIAEFLAEPAIDGALVGGASLKPDEMAGIVARAGVTAAARRRTA
jgi:triosephosphate isomerase (TIM)